MVNLPQAFSHAGEKENRLLIGFRLFGIYVSLKNTTGRTREREGNK